MPTTNTTLRDRAIRHAMYLLRIGNAEAERMVVFIDQELLPSVVAQLARRLARVDERGFDLGPRTTARMEALEASLREIVSETTGIARTEFIGRMRELAADEGHFAMGVIGAESPVDLDTVLPTPAALRQAALARPFEGEAIKGWFDQLETNTQALLTRTVRIGMAQGDTIDQLTARIRGTAAQGFTDGAIQATRAQAEAIARSGVIHVSTQARERTYEENAELIKAVQWVSTLDARTCPECGGLDGQTFDVGEGPRPPAHFNCRCTTVPVLRSWKELGIELPEAPEGTRASMNGQVAETITYPDWLAGQPRSVVVDALGPSRAALFLKGDLEVRDFVDTRGNTLTLEQLRRVEGDAFKRAGLDPGE